MTDPSNPYAFRPAGAPSSASRAETTVELLGGSAEDHAPGRTPRRGRRRSVTIGIVAVLVAGGVAAGPPLFRAWQRHQQAQSYRAGHAAYVRGDCSRAIQEFTKADRPTVNAATAARAREESAACEAFARSEAIAAKGPATAVSAYSLLITLGTTPELTTVAVARAQQALSTAKPEELATEELCANGATLREQGVLTKELEPKVMPEILLVCATRAAGNHLLPTAITGYAAAAKYPATHDRAVAGLAEVLIVQATLKEAARGPGVADRGKAGGSGATLVLRNNDPWPVAVALSGPTHTIVQLPACDGCRADDVSCRGSSPDRSAVVTVKVKPGRYPVAWQARVRGEAFMVRSTWTLRAGHRAEACLDITALPGDQFVAPAWPVVSG